MAPFEIRDATLKRLRAVKKAMNSPRWTLALRKADQQTRTQAALLRLDVDDAIMTLENVQLATIRDQLKANEAALTEGTEKLKDALRNLEKVKSVLSVVTRVLNVVKRVISIL